MLALPRAAMFLARVRQAWPWALLPVLIFSALWIGAIALAAHWVPQLWAATPGDSGLWSGWQWLADVIMIVLTAIVGWVLALMLAPALSAPALERLVLLRERELDAPPRAAAGWLRETWCALSAQLLSFALLGPPFALLWVLSFFVPVLAPFLLPIKLTLSAFWLAFGFLDYPLSLRGLSFSRRLSLMRRGALGVLGFGFACLVAFAVPFVSLLVLPVAVCAAAELAVSLERAEMWQSRAP
jgi:CysZ protein